MRGTSFAIAALLLTSFVASAPARADRPARHAAEAMGVWRMEGVASYYCCYFHGRRAANGSRFDQMGSTAAHRTWPFGTRVRVRNPGNGRSEIVTITDRGPFIPGRVIDLSLGTMRRLGLEQAGVAMVHLEVLR